MRRDERLPRKFLAGTALWMGLCGGCGDALLPSDFEGPPAAEVSGNVVSADGSLPDASRPKLSMVWLGSLDGASTSLFAQNVAFKRSSRLERDWDIGLGTPPDDMRLELPMESRATRVAVGKLVYFDDVVSDGRLDWTCTGTRCDRVKAVSDEFVVYLDGALMCDAADGRPARVKVGAGYHYYALEDGRARELGTNVGFTFAVADRTPAVADPTSELRSFADALVRSWDLQLLAGCR